MPSDRSAKSARVVPQVVEATIVAQYSHGLNPSARICAMTKPTSSTPKIAVPIRYPYGTGWAVVSPSQVIVTVSPAVSPSVVARILIIQNPSVTAGTLASASRLLMLPHMTDGGNGSSLSLGSRMGNASEGGDDGGIRYRRALLPGTRSGSAFGLVQGTSERRCGMRRRWRQRGRSMVVDGDGRAHRLRSVRG